VDTGSLHEPTKGNVWKETVVLGRRHRGLGLLLAGLELFLALGLPGAPNLFLLGLAALTIVGLVMHFRTVVRLEPAALVVVSAKGTRCYGWSDLLEASWVGGAGSMNAWSGPVLRVRGGAYDEPGPNLPSRVASLLIFGRKANNEAARQVADAARQHGVPYTPDLLKLINSGRRRPRLPGEE
jgi:Zn-dependent protease with chaperone function